MGSVFETNSSEKGFFSISSKYCKTGMKPHHYHGISKIVLAVWKSPYADDEVLRELVELAIENAKAEEIRNQKCEKNISKDYLYNENAIAIRDSCMNDLLRCVDGDYTKTIFCKKLRYIEEELEETIIITNKSRKGYTYNMTGNNRYYVFNLKSSLLEGVA